MSRIFKVLAETDMSVSPCCSSGLQEYLKQKTVCIHSQPHWCFGKSEASVAMLMVTEIVYLETIVTLGKHSDRTYFRGRCRGVMKPVAQLQPTACK